MERTDGLVTGRKTGKAGARMKTYVRVVSQPARGSLAAADAIRLDHEARRKTRQRTTTVAGTEAALLLPRGTVLRDGDVVQAEDGGLAVIVAADEALSEVRCDEPTLLARVAFHLGNRHAEVMLAAGCVRYPADAVLDDMLRGLGLVPQPVLGPFEPEPGAYVAILDAAVGAVRAPWIP